MKIGSVEFVGRNVKIGATEFVDCDMKYKFVLLKAWATLVRMIVAEHRNTYRRAGIVIPKIRVNRYTWRGTPHVTISTLDPPTCSGCQSRLHDYRSCPIMRNPWCARIHREMSFRWLEKILNIIWPLPVDEHEAEKIEAVEKAIRVRAA